MLCWMVPQAWFPQCSGASNCGEIVSTFSEDNSHELSLHVATQRSSLGAMRALHRLPDSRNGFSLDTIAGLGGSFCRHGFLAAVWSRDGCTSDEIRRSTRLRITEHSFSICFYDQYRIRSLSPLSSPFHKYILQVLLVNHY